MKKQYLYGATGVLSLLGFIGLFTDDRIFLAFFAFAVDFQYFFLPSDEMVDAYMSRSAALGFYAGMLVTAGGTLYGFFRGLPAEDALLRGFAAGWAAAVIVHAFSTVLFRFREGWSAIHD